MSVFGLRLVPGFLDRASNSNADSTAFEQAFRLTGFFFDRHVYEPRGLTPPEARAGFVAALRRALQ